MFELDFDFSAAGLIAHAIEGFIGLLVNTIVSGVGGFLNGLVEAATTVPVFFGG